QWSFVSSVDRVVTGALLFEIGRLRSGLRLMVQRGRTAKIDLAELERLSAMQCMDEEIGAWFGVTTRTIERRRKNKKFSEVMERGKAKGRISVRRMQMKLLKKGTPPWGFGSGRTFLGRPMNCVIRLTVGIC